MAATAVSGPYHAGELSVQAAAGEREDGVRNGAVIAGAVVPGAARFIEALSVAVVASVDAEGQPWCSALVGPRGSFGVPTPGIVALARAAFAGAADPLWDHLRHDPRLGLLFIEPSTRRRYRVNGRVEDVAADPLAVRVAEAYPNCPQYIQRRHLVVERGDAGAGDDVEVGADLGAAERLLLASADTFFLASANPEGELDASHRGGNPGFVGVLDERTLRVPDYAGNSMFNTLGNLRLEPRAGLLVVDFDSGETLQLAGTTEVDLDADPQATGGTGRAWTFTTRTWRRARLGARLQAELLDFSPHNPPVAGPAETSATRAGYRPLRVVAAMAEGANARSVLLAPVDGELPEWRAGQFLPVGLRPPGSSELVLRTYTIAGVPADGVLRLTVQREPAAAAGLPPGVASSYVHDGLAPGDELLAAAPRGGFVLDDSDRPVVLLSGGIGITPMLAMLRELAAAQNAGATARDVTFVHSVRTARQRPFAEEIVELAGSLHRARLYLVETDEGERARRVDAEWLRRVLPFDDYVFFLCGPQGFMQTIYDALREAGVRDADVHAEAFGPAALSRRPDNAARPAAPAGASARPSEGAASAAEVVFAVSGTTAAWTPGAGTLLELAEASGIQAPFSCRAGACQSCAVRLARGAVTYPIEPVVAVPEGSVLTCSAVPRAPRDGSPATITLEL